MVTSRNFVNSRWTRRYIRIPKWAYFQSFTGLSADLAIGSSGDLKVRTKPVKVIPKTRSPDTGSRSHGDPITQITRFPLSPERPIQSPVLDRFRDVLGLNSLRPLQIGNRTRDFEDTVVRPGGQALLVHPAFQQPFAIRR